MLGNHANETEWRLDMHLHEIIGLEHPAYSSDAPKQPGINAFNNYDEDVPIGR